MDKITLVDIVRTLMAQSDALSIPSRKDRTFMKDAVVLELIPLGGINYHLIILTAYDGKGLKSHRAVPLNHFLEVIGCLEDSLDIVASSVRRDDVQPFHFENTLAGQSAKGPVKEFLSYTNCHRFAFIRDGYVGLMMRKFNTESNREVWSDMGLNVLVTHYS